MPQRHIELPDDQDIAGISEPQRPRPFVVDEQRCSRGPPCALCSLPPPPPPQPRFPRPCSWQAQGVPQTVQLTKVDVIKVATGFRASKVIGSSVVNDAGETVGRVDDIIIGEDGKAPFVVLAVGGFLGIGDKLVVLPYEQIKTMDEDRHARRDQRGRERPAHVQVRA